MISYISISDDLIIDTGSSNTWLGANQHYKKTDTSVKTGNKVVSVMSQDSWPSSN